MSSTTIPRVVPAQLSFLAIYNPALGTSDETFEDQIVFYYSKAAKARARIDGRDAQAESELQEQENEKLRQVGLAQGMVGFARSFSNGEAVDSVETHKSRIVLRELEKGWWILASIDLTQLPAAASKPDDANSAAPSIEYSSREVSPPALLLQQLERANSTFLLHHGAKLDTLFSRLGRDRFCNALERFWTRFANNWDVLLHGSPAVDLFGGMKLAAGGELGMGVGEEEWGSGEREVLEEYARRTNGLVDLMVSRFGEPSPLQDSKADMKEVEKDPTLLEPWLGSGRAVTAVDGIVFSGTGAVSRRSLRDISHWVENIYTHGEYVYGVRDNPASNRRKRRRRNPKPEPPQSPSPKTHKDKGHSGTALEDDMTPHPGVPPPIVTAAEASLNKVSSAIDAQQKSSPSKPEPIMASLGDTETWVKYLTLGYGTTWGGKKPESTDKAEAAEATVQRTPSPEVSMRYVEPMPDIDRTEEKLKAQVKNETSGYFIVGLKGNMEDEEMVDEDDEEGESNNRIFLRTLHVELTDKAMPETPGIDDDVTPSAEKDPYFTLNSRKLSRLRPVVYVHRPFIYTFLFHQRTESLTLAAFYHNLHTYFSPLHRPLTNSTSPDRVAARIAAASNPHTTTAMTTGSGPNTQPIYDLVYDPRTLTVHTSLPNIPEPGTFAAEGLTNTTSLSGWSRVEALNVHSQIIATVSSTRRSSSEIERTCKTNRGWWVVWMRLPPSDVVISTDASQESQEFNAADLREAFLVRRARDATPATQSSGRSLGSGMWRLGGASTGEKMGGAAAGWGPKGLAEGIGIDPRRYVEGLLSLNR